MTPGGGTIAAFGLKYQYMATVELFLQHLRDNIALIPQTTLVVEPVVVDSHGQEDDIVDFGFLTDDMPTHHVQVKSSIDPSNNPLQPAPARAVLERLITHDATNSALYTNKPLSPTLLGDVEVDARALARFGTVSYVWPNGPGGQRSTQRDRPRITVDGRNHHQVRDSIADLVGGFRKERGRNHTATTCSLLVPILLDRVFGAAAGTDASRLEALDFLELVAMPDSRIAQVAGGFDWGLPVAGIPNYVSTFPRLDYLSKIKDLFPVEAAVAPPRVALVGHTGSGKSVIASDYCHLDAINYQFMCWIDCRDADFIDAQVVNHVEQLTKGALSPEQDAVAVFTGILGRHSGPWLLILDGVVQRSDVDRVIPTRGHGVVLVTSTNSLNWWPGTAVIEVGEFTTEEAIGCFASYAGLDRDQAEQHHTVLTEIVHVLGHVPLAVSMAGVYFRNADGTPSELAAHYFEDLEALDDNLSIPSGFNQTAFKAIQHAVASLGKHDASGHGLTARAILEMGSLIAPEQIPLNLMVPLAAAPEHSLDVAEVPHPKEVEPKLRRGVIAALRSQSIARRVVSETAGPTSETINVHPLVHQILQMSRLAALPPGQLESDAFVLMHFLRGWLGASRSNGDYFATELLRMHSEALLAVVKQHEPLVSYTDQSRRCYLYTKALLEGELSTCHASRRRFDLSLGLGQAAGSTMMALSEEPTARALTVIIAVNMITDLSFAKAPAAVLAAITAATLPAITVGVADEKESIREASYTAAGELRTMLNRTSEYQVAPELEDVRSRIDALVETDPHPDARPSTVNNRINELYSAGDYKALERMLPPLRQNASPDDSVGLDALHIVVQLHLGTLDEVQSGLEELISIDPHAGYLSNSLVEALTKVGREIEQYAQNNSADRRRLLLMRAAIQTRLVQLIGSAQP